MWRLSCSLILVAGATTPLFSQTASTAANTLSADSAWVTIQELQSHTGHLASAPRDSLLAARYRAWSDTRNQLLRDVGTAFVQHFPRDARICNWLVNAESAAPSPLRYAVHPRPHAPLFGDLLKPIYSDSITQLVAAWDARLPEMRTACIQSASPDSMRVMVASEQTNEQIRPVELDLWFPPDTAHPTLADTVHWDQLTHLVLGLGAQFPAIANEYVRNPALSMLNLLHRYHPAGEEPFLQALQMSPNTSFKELGHAQEALAQARKTPMTMHVMGVDGKLIDLKAFRGKLVLLDFWAASWCSACREQEPLIEAAYERYHAEGLEIIGVALEDDDHRTFFEQYLKAQGITWPQYFPGGSTSTDNAYFRRFGFDGAPQLLLLDRRGLLIGEEGGSRGIQKLEPLIKQQLGVAN